MSYFWLWVVIFLGLLEIITINLVSIWFVISGLVSLCLSFVTDSFLIQFACFVILGIILMITTKRVFASRIVRGEKTNLDRVIGMKGIVTEDIDCGCVGEVKVDGKRWSSVSSEKISKGSFVRILKINGVKLEVESWEE